MSIFGWSYPPGCSGPPDEEEETLYTIELVADELDFLEELLQDYISKRNDPNAVPSNLRNWKLSVAVRLLRQLQDVGTHTL